MMNAALAQTVLEHSPAALLLLAPDGSITYLNSAAEQLFGYPRAQLVGTHSSVLVAKACREDFHAVLSRLPSASSTSGASPAPFAGAGRRGDGREFPLEITCAALPAAVDTGSGAVVLTARATGGERHDGVPASGITADTVTADTARALGAPADSATADSATADSAPAGAAWAAASRAASAAAAARRRVFGPLESRLVPSTTGHLPRLTPVEQDDQLKAAVLRDALTGLPNGTLFNERLAAALRRPDPLDVLLLDVDGFRSYNNMLSGSAADEVLVEVASRLRNCVRPHDTVARLGGAEFVILLTECLNVEAVAKRITESLCTPARVGGSLVRPAVSIGLASRTPQTHDGAELLRQADSALAAAKAAGKNTWLQFRSSAP